MQANPVGPISYGSCHEICKETHPNKPTSASEDAVWEPVQRSAIVCSFFTGLCGILLGYDVGVVAGALSPIKHHFTLGDFEIQFFVGVLNWMALVGALAAAPLGDQYGRRAGLSCAASCFLVGNLFTTFAWSYVWLIIGRMIAGFAVGITLVLGPVYIAEIAPTAWRGFLTTGMEVSINIGIVLGYISGWAFHGMSNPTNWRVMLSAGSIPPVVILVGTQWCMLETPRWLVSKGRTSEAIAVLQQVLGPKEAERAAAAAAAQQQSSTVLKGETSLSYFEVFLHREARWTIFLGAGVAFFSQATGIETILYYSNGILHEAGLSSNSLFMATFGLAFTKLTAILVSAYFVDTWGRRPLLLLSGSGLCLSMTLLGIAFELHLPAGVQVLAMIVFLICFSLGYGPITYVINSEVHAQSWRSKGMSIGMLTGRITSAMVATSFLSLTHLFGYSGTFMLYALIAAIGTFFVATCLPETKGTCIDNAGNGGAAHLLSTSL